MPSIMSPSVTPNLPSQPASHSAPRGRPTEEAQGRSFGEALEHSRAASALKTQENPDSLPLEPMAHHNDKLKPSQSGRSGDKKDDLPADLQAMALLAPATVPMNLVSKTIHTGPQDDSAAGVSVAQVTLGVAKSPLSGDALAVAAPALDTNLLPKAVSAAMSPASKTSHSGPQDDSAAGGSVAQVTLGVAQSLLPRDALAVAALDTNLLPKAVIAEKGMVQVATPLSQHEAPAQAGAAQPVLPLGAGRVKATFVSGDGAQAIDDLRRAPIQDAMSTERKTPLDTRVGTPFDEHLNQAAAAGSQASPTTLALMSAATDRPSAPVGQTPALSVHPVVGGSEWGPALGQQMIRMSTSGHHVAELSLNPAGLGPLKVTLTIGDNQAQAVFVSAHEGVRNAIEAALPQLRKTLADHGINLGQTSVGAESQQPPRQGGTFGQQPSGRSTPPDYPGPGRFDSVAIAEPLLTGLPSALRRSGAGVDTFA